jgi:hypothetical protein
MQWQVGREEPKEGRGRGSSPSSNCTHSAWPPAQAMWSGVYFLPPCRHTPPPVEITGTVGKSQSLVLIKSLISSRRHRRRVHRGHGGAREHAGQVRRQTHPEQQQRARASISCQGRGGQLPPHRHAGTQDWLSLSPHTPVVSRVQQRRGWCAALLRRELLQRRPQPPHVTR